jgi:DNA-binding GntR family transcriptional regulator
VREGLLLLQSESSVTLIPRRGFVVNAFSKDDVHDLFWAQATLAAELAGRATAKMSKAEVERLEAIQSEHERRMSPAIRRSRRAAGTSFIARSTSQRERRALHCC